MPPTPCVCGTQPGVRIARPLRAFCPHTISTHTHTGDSMDQTEIVIAAAKAAHALVEATTDLPEQPAYAVVVEYKGALATLTVEPSNQSEDPF